MASRWLGQLLIILGACSFSLCNGFVKSMMLEGITKWSIFCIRGALSAALNLISAWFLYGSPGIVRCVLGKPEPTQDEAQQQLNNRLPGASIYLRGVLASLAATALIIVYDRFMVFSDAFAIFLGLITIFSNIMAAVVLGEVVKPSTMVGGTLSVVGIFLVVKPTFLFGHGSGVIPDGSLHPTLAGLALLVVASLSASGANLFMRALNGRSPQTLFHGFMVVFTLEAAVAMLLTSTPNIFPHTGWQWFCFFGYTLSSQAGQIFFAKGFQYENLSIGSVLTNSEMAFAFLIDALMLHEQITLLSVCGAVVIFLGAAVVALGTARRGSTPDDEEKKEVKIKEEAVQLLGNDGVKGASPAEEHALKV